MKARLQDKYRAIELRKGGLSYKEIQKEINVSKSLLSGWLKYIKLSTEEEGILKSRMLERQNNGRIKSIFVNRANRLARENIVEKEAAIKFAQFANDSQFHVGVSLYWAEGSKRTSHFQFVNSDPDMILFMYQWVQKYLKINKESIKFRLFIHKISGYENSIEVWSKKLGIEPYLLSKTTYKNTPHGLKKNPDYNGCLRIDIYKIHYLRMMKAWQKLLIQYYSDRA